MRLEIDSGAPSGKIVGELREVGMRFKLPDGSSKVIVDNFSATILRGDKVGLIGPNGAGKTTAAQAHPRPARTHCGKVRQGSKIEVAYFDQMRSTLDLDATLPTPSAPAANGWRSAASAGTS